MDSVTHHNDLPPPSRKIGKYSPRMFGHQMGAVSQECAIQGIQLFLDNEAMMESDALVGAHGVH